MSLFAELELPPEAFALAGTLEALPDAVIEVERVVAAEDILTPYFWVANVSGEAFEAAAATDPSIRDVRRLDAFEEATLYRGEWTATIESAVVAFTRVGAVILDAVGQHDCWEVQLRFDDRDQLVEFQSYCADNGVDFRIRRLYEVANAHTGRQYGLTEKQHEALVAAWKSGFFESPAEATLSEVADDLGISQQALSQRMRKGYDGLIASTLVTESSGDE